MSKNCRIEFVEGELTCLCNHRDYNNCDLVIKERLYDEEQAKKLGITLVEYYGGEEEE